MRTDTLTNIRRPSKRPHRGSLADYDRLTPCQWTANAVEVLDLPYLSRLMPPVRLPVWGILTKVTLATADHWRRNAGTSLPEGSNKRPVQIKNRLPRRKGTFFK